MFSIGKKARPKPQPKAPPKPPVPISGVLLDDLVYLRAQFVVSADLTVRRLTVCGRETAIVTIEGMVDRHMMANAVILPLAEGRSRMYYRSLLYTAVTRAKKLLIILGSASAVRTMVQSHKRIRRYANLRFLLEEVCDG